MRGRAFRFASVSFLFAAAVACGSRTGLFLDEAEFGPNPIDGGDNPNIDGGRRDARNDRNDIEDAPPPLDVTPPMDVNRIDCAEAGTTYIYVISNSYQLYSFDPATNATKFIGNIACPSDIAETPFSMAVDRKGVAYILFTDERLYRVSTLNAACLSTSYVPRQSNFGVFGMGFATSDEPGGPVEHLYVAGDRRNNSASGLARIDVTNFKLTTVGDPDIEHAELTGTGSGALYAFYKRSTTSPPSYIGELDTTNGQVKGEKKLDTIDQGEGWAFAFWGGDFYMFHAPNGNSVVTRYRPADDTLTQVATLPSIIVGAGVSTCAPQQ
jgi:hypothetical protein